MHMEQQRQLMMRERQQKQAAAAAAAMAAGSSSSTTPAVSADSTRVPAAVSPGSANTQQQQQQANKRQLTLTVSTLLYWNSLIRGYSEKHRVGVCGPLPKTLTTFKTKICDFSYPNYVLTLKSIPCFRPALQLVLKEKST